MTSKGRSWIDSINLSWWFFGIIVFISLSYCHIFVSFTYNYLVLIAWACKLTSFFGNFFDLELSYFSLVFLSPFEFLIFRFLTEVFYYMFWFCDSENILLSFNWRLLPLFLLIFLKNLFWETNLDGLYPFTKYWFFYLSWLETLYDSIFEFCLPLKFSFWSSLLLLISL